MKPLLNYVIDYALAALTVSKHNCTPNVTLSYLTFYNTTSVMSITVGCMFLYRPSCCNTDNRVTVRIHEVGKFKMTAYPMFVDGGFFVCAQ